MKLATVGLLAVATLVAAAGPAQTTRTFTGTITDSMCPAGNHSQMRMGPTDAECTIGCNDGHGAPYVLYDGRDTYTLSDQKAPQKLAGKKVTVTGTLDAKSKTIRVTSIAAAK